MATNNDALDAHGARIYGETFKTNYTDDLTELGARIYGAPADTEADSRGARAYGRNDDLDARGARVYGHGPGAVLTHVRDDGGDGGDRVLRPTAEQLDADAARMAASSGGRGNPGMVVRVNRTTGNEVGPVRYERY
ncbi:hypothetical protein [Corynebacterium senegalense]|uniref:hypothetical protein n=1 Tax=Corynebacterium senegalense TaxID=2080750 RepID=UPI000E201829|nr:hypothetical protein [Corynebacterium senegalense]